MRYTVGLTGGIGTGKSTAASILAERGAAVIDADALVHRLYEPGGAGAAALSDRLGAPVLDEHGAVDRELLARRLFDDPEARATVEEIVHPLVMGEVAAWLGSLAPARLPVVEAALLVESGQHRFFTCLVVVTCPPSIQWERVRGRHPDWGDEEIEKRLEAQMPLAEKAKHADLVIDNSGSREDLRRECAAVFDQLMARKHRWESERGAGG